MFSCSTRQSAVSSRLGLNSRLLMANRHPFGCRVSVLFQGSSRRQLSATIDNVTGPVTGRCPCNRLPLFAPPHPLSRSFLNHKHLQKAALSMYVAAPPHGLLRRGGVSPLVVSPARGRRPSFATLPVQCRLLVLIFIRRQTNSPARVCGALTS